MMFHHLSCVLEDVFFFEYLFDHGCDLDIEILLQSCPGHWTETGLNIRTM